MWNKEQEVIFFSNSQKFCSVEQLFYLSDDNRYFAYWPKSYNGKKTTLQSRNALIGNFTEKFSLDLVKNFASQCNLFSVQGVVCEEIGLSPHSAADVAICKTNKIIQIPSDIVMIFEIKMSIVWNWENKQTANGNELICLGDYRSHQGNPGLLRSDSMLKAIGKSLNIRVSSYKASHIPIIVLGNTPISSHYYKKVDFLKAAGIIQGFWSVNPNPLDNDLQSIKNTLGNGFIRMDSELELNKSLEKIIKEHKEFFSSMKSKKELGEIIEIANREVEVEKKALKFLELIRK